MAGKRLSELALPDGDIVGCPAEGEPEHPSRECLVDLCISSERGSQHRFAYARHPLDAEAMVLARDGHGLHLAGDEAQLESIKLLAREVLRRPRWNAPELDWLLLIGGTSP